MDDDDRLPDGSIVYTMEVVAPNGEIAGRKQLRIYPINRVDNEQQGKIKGFELARDAMFHAGFWEKARAAEREKTRQALLNQINEANKQLARLAEMEAAS